MAPLSSLPLHRPLRTLGPGRLDFESLWSQADDFQSFLNRLRNHPSLWLGTYRHATIPSWALLEFGDLPHGLRLLVLNADWCLDSATTVPLLARLAERVPGVELRLLERDEYPEVMDRYLTDQTRSIPLVILLDDEFRELGHWGPRPAPLQAWVRANLETLPKDERLKEQRRWYLRDAGETTLRELLESAMAEERT
jgi:hypothetical protein